MIKSDTMYEFYTADLTVKLEKAVSKKEELERLLEGLTKLLTVHKDEINAYCSLKFDEVLKLTRNDNTKIVKFPDYNIYANGKQINTKAIKMYIDKYIKVHSNYKRVKSDITRYRKERIAKKLYKKILMKFNQKIVDKIVHNNYEFNMIPSFGRIGVIKTYSKRKHLGS
jgi:hypothetical protein